jgi:cytochrome c
MPFIMAVRHRLALCVLLVVAANAFAAGDAKRGAQVFRQCLACHSSAPGEHLTGPSLAHAFNQKAGSAEGFQRYSDALKRSALVWDEATLDKWLANPARLIPGTSMTFPGIKERQAREDVIVYLKALDEGKAPQPAQGMARPKMDLKNAPPAGQVRSITYCGDTYTVETADGKAEKVWEFNLRFKTDASKFGPEPGKPVVIGAGMQGDRAAIVFASPDEISKAIRQACR